jgi:hypothetical protein
MKMLNVISSAEGEAEMILTLDKRTNEGPEISGHLNKRVSHLLVQFETWSPSAAFTLGYLATSPAKWIEQLCGVG